MKIEDAGFDWKIMGPDVSDIEFVAWQSDQDAYACSGQKCSAQSIMFMHENWEQVSVCVCSASVCASLLAAFVCAAL